MISKVERGKSFVRRKRGQARLLLLPRVWPKPREAVFGIRMGESEFTLIEKGSRGCSEQSQNVALESDAPEMKITEHILALLIMYLKL